MHPEINTTREAAYKQMQEKHKYHIRYLVKNREEEKKKLDKMNRQIKRDSKGKVAKASMDDFNRIEAFRNELNTERFRLKNERI